MSDGTSQILEAWTQFGLASALMLVAALLFLAASGVSALHSHFSARRVANVLAQSRAEWDRLWTEVELQSRDKPHTAVNAAHELVCELLRTRGLHFQLSSTLADAGEGDFLAESNLPSGAAIESWSSEGSRAAFEMYEHYRKAVDHHGRSAPGRVDPTALNEALEHYRWLFRALWDPDRVSAAYQLRRYAHVPRVSSAALRTTGPRRGAQRSPRVCQVLREIDVPPPSSTQLA